MYNRCRKACKPFIYAVYRLFPENFGGDDETRTHYLDNANVALYQMSYAPKKKL